MFKRIDTVFLPVQDTNGAISWFEEKCGFVLRWHDEENGYAAMDVGNGETAFTLVRSPQMGTGQPAQMNGLIYIRQISMQPIIAC